MFHLRTSTPHRTPSALALLLLLAVVPLAGCRASAPIVNDASPYASSEATVSAESASLEALEIALEPVAEGFDQPLYVAGAGDGSGRLFVVEKTGRIWIVRGREKSSAPWLDMSDRVSTDSERGLLGLAFASDFASTGEFYIHYSDTRGDTVIARMTAPDPSSDAPVDLGLEQQLLTVKQPFSNHNGGMIAFGPDSYLYIGLGDGGSGGDPNGNGQNRATLLGAILRIDVNDPIPADANYVGPGYVLPSDNPFVEWSHPNVPSSPAPEIWAWGLRNPWRFSFDRENGDLWVGDVGQNTWEEIDFVSGDAIPANGYNFGWNRYEGTHAYPEGSEPGDAAELTMPVVEYDHSAGNSVTGGYVYRGTDYPALVGTYLYGDFGSGRIWGLQRTASGVENRLLLDTGRQVVSFGEDDEGELYVLDFGGGLYRVTAR